MNFKKARFNMVEQQVRPWDVSNPRVLDVISTIQREDFTPDNYRDLAYSDTNIPLGEFDNQSCYMAKPIIEGRILQALNIQEDDVILEIGTGTGYLTACLAMLGRHVDTVDIHLALTDIAKQNLAPLSLTNITLSTGDASQNWAQKIRYDVIIINSSMPSIPTYYKKLLKTNGRMFVVTGYAPAMNAQRVTRRDKNHWLVENLFETCIEPMTGTSSLNPTKSVFEF